MRTFRSISCVVMVYYCYYNKSIHKTSEMMYVFKNCYFCILILCENGA